MSVAIKKVEGVDTVKVSLNEGLAEISFKLGNRATLEQIRGIVRRNGFTPKGADVRAVGRVVERNGKPALAVTGTDAVYLLAEDGAGKGKVLELQKEAKDRPVVVHGFVPESGTDSADPLTFRVREFALGTP